MCAWCQQAARISHQNNLMRLALRGPAPRQAGADGPFLGGWFGFLGGCGWGSGLEPQHAQQARSGLQAAPVACKTPPAICNASPLFWLQNGDELDRNEDRLCNRKPRDSADLRPALPRHHMRLADCRSRQYNRRAPFSQRSFLIWRNRFSTNPHDLIESGDFRIMTFRLMFKIRSGHRNAIPAHLISSHSRHLISSHLTAILSLSHRYLIAISSHLIAVSSQSHLISSLSHLISSHRCFISISSHLIAISSQSHR